MLNSLLLSGVSTLIFGSLILFQTELTILFIIIAVLGFIFLSVVGVVLHYLINSRLEGRKEFDYQARRREFEQFAQRRGWKLEPSPQNPAILEMVRLFDGFEPITLNMINSAINGQQVSIFDLRSKRRKRGTRIDYFYTVFVVRSKELRLPVFYLMPSRNTNFIFEEGFDIDFSHRPHFSNKYLLFSDSNTKAGNFVKDMFGGSGGQNDFWVRKLFDEVIITFFENDSSDLNAAGGGEYLFVYSRSCDRAKFVAGADFDKHLRYLFNLFDLFRNASRRLNQQ